VKNEECRCKYCNSILATDLTCARSDATCDLISSLHRHIEELKLRVMRDHCCQHYADLSGLNSDEVKRVGSCGCLQAKLEAELMRPVVEAAEEWYDSMNKKRYVDSWESVLENAIQEYRKDFL